MKKILCFKITLFFIVFSYAQQMPDFSTLLPPEDYKTLRDSCTSVDVLFTTEKGGSISIEGGNTALFSSFVDVVPAEEESGLAKSAIVMWQRGGHEFLSGEIFLRDTSGYVVFRRNGIAYVHALTKRGVAFLREQSGH